MAEAEIVEDDPVVAGFRECLGAMAPDIAGPAGDENSGIGLPWPSALRFRRDHASMLR
jgi:hypothetical protein